MLLDGSIYLLINLKWPRNYLTVQLIHTAELNFFPPLGTRARLEVLVLVAIVAAGTDEGGDDQQLPRLPLALSFLPSNSRTDQRRFSSRFFFLSSRLQGAALSLSLVDDHEVKLSLSHSWSMLMV